MPVSGISPEMPPTMTNTCSPSAVVRPTATSCAMSERERAAIASPRMTEIVEALVRHRERVAKGPDAAPGRSLRHGGAAPAESE